MRKVAIYSRVSTIVQSEEGYSIGGQIEALTKYCEALGWTIYKDYSDAGYSGGKLERPAITELIEDGKNKKFDTVLVYKLDRLSRNVKDTLYLVKDVFNANDIHFVSIKENIDTSTPMGNLFLTLLSAIAEFEREQIKERMQFGVLGRAKSGKTTSWKTPPYGYRYDKENKSLTIDEYEALNVKIMYDMINSGHSIMGITKYAREHFTGNTWSHQKVKRILTNETYKGLVKYRDNIFKGDHEAIIDDLTFEKAQIAISKRIDVMDNTRPFQGLYMLSNIARCGYCGAPLRIDTSKPRKDGTRRRTYVCSNKTKRRADLRSTRNNYFEVCEKSSRYNADHIEKYVIDRLRELQKDEKYQPSKNNNGLDIEALNKKINAIDKKISKLNDLYVNDLISLTKLKSDHKKLNDEKSKLVDVIKSNSFDDSRLDGLRELKEKSDITKASYEVQKRLVKQIVDRVDVTGDDINVILRF